MVAKKTHNKKDAEIQTIEEEVEEIMEKSSM